jgi:hypothetical protein
MIIDIADDGEITITTKGYTGKACIEDSKFLKDLLGHEISAQLVAAYYATTEADEKQLIPICG